MQTHRLEAVPGSATIRSITVHNGRWSKQPGAYVQTSRNGLVYYIVNGSVRRCTEQEAKMHALSMLPPEQQVAHDQAGVTIISDAAAVEGPITAPEGVLLAADVLARDGADFEVSGEAPLYANGGVASPPMFDEGWTRVYVSKASARVPFGQTLHYATATYEVIPHIEPLSILDRAAARQDLTLRNAWVGVDMTLHRDESKRVPVYGRRVGLNFNFPSENMPADWRTTIRAGGSIVTSHDGSMAIRVSAAIDIEGIGLVFHPRIEAWKHSREALGRIKNAERVLDFAARAVRGLIEDAQATVNVPDDEAAPVVLESLRPELFRPVTETECPDPEDRAKAQAKRDATREKCLQRLHARAQAITAKVKNVYLGGFRYVLAAPYASSDRVSSDSMYDGLARSRMTDALLALARHAGAENVGVVPDSNGQRVS